jgi:DMSO/TMAO reductase YedYZ molybdopterin-dependent catalytic subunit
MRWSRAALPLLVMFMLLAACAPPPSPATLPPVPSSEAGLPYTCSPIKPTDQLGLTGTPPKDFDFSKYRLLVDGLVEKPLSLTYPEVLGYPAITRSPLLDCPGFFQDCAQWTGVPLTALLDAAGVKPGARFIMFYTLDNYQTSLPLERMRRDGVFLAWQVNGETLPLAHGYPLRLVVSGETGGVWVKWVYRLELTAD